MGDRQDIDALLIGALYGELTPADEAKLAAHLESHPADKTALDDLKTARARVAESRIFEMQPEPPQAISAVLLQEAARRAPRRAVGTEGEPRESWFHRFVRSFAAHPAMAAAATLVLVVGVAGTLYMKNGDNFAEKTATTSANDVAMTAPQAPPAAEPAQVAQGSAAAYAVQLADEQKQVQQKEAEIASANTDRGKAEVARADSADSYQTKKPAAHSKKGYIEVTTPQQMPKEMAADDKSIDGDFVAKDNRAPGGPANGTRGAVGGGASGGGGGAPATGSLAGVAAPADPTPSAATTSIAANSPPPPPPQAPKSKFASSAPATTAKPSPAPAKTVAKAPEQDAPVEAQPSGDTSLIAWAKKQHETAKARVKAGDCAGAAQIAVVVRNQAFGYFQQNMQNDRDLKGCAAYIDNAVKQNEEHSSKAKVARPAADEEAPSRK
jgi:hypothetical protein